MEDLIAVIKTNNEQFYIKKYFSDINSIFLALEGKLRSSTNTKYRTSFYSKFNNYLNSSKQSEVTGMKSTRIQNALKKQGQMIFQTDFYLIEFKNKIPVIIDEILFLISGIHLIQNEEKYLSSESTSENDNDSTSNISYMKSKLNLENFNLALISEINNSDPYLVLNAFYSLCKNNSKHVNKTYITLHSMQKNFVLFI